MKLSEIVERLDLKVLAGREFLGREVTGGYTCDLISDVMAHGQSGQAWITLQAHVNTIAAASLKDLAAVILVGGREPGEEMLAKAEEEGLPVLMTPWPAFEVSGRLYRLIGD